MRAAEQRRRTAALGTACALAVLVGAVPAAGAAHAAQPAITWAPCDPAGFECATLPVPLDHDEPEGPAIDLAVVRRPAGDPAQRIGTLFFNPGGPGGQGTEDLPAWAYLFPETVLDRFDVVSFDPRGIGDSTAVQCYDTAAEEAAALAAAPVGFPVGSAEETAWIDTWRDFGERCAQRNGDLLEHVGTADVARDLDLLREAVGEETMRYLGVSYGTLLGATYANLFPDRVGAMVLDGNLDPVAWFAEPDEDDGLSTSLRVGTDLGSDDTLQQFLDRCGAVTPDRCAFSAGSPEATRAEYAALLARLREGPVSIARAEGAVTIPYALAVAAVSGLLFTVDPVPPQDPIVPGWTALAGLLEDLQQAPPATAAPDAPPPAPPSAPERYTGANQGFAVQCAESPNPRNPDAYLELARIGVERAGDVGRFWPWGDEPCATWPARAQDVYAGPWDVPTAAPVVVVGTTHDPSTPYQGSVRMADLLADARLLTVDGYGHTQLLNPSDCAADHVTRYLVAGDLPPEGTVCPQTVVPFPAT